MLRNNKFLIFYIIMFIVWLSVNFSNPIQADTRLDERKVAALERIARAVESIDRKLTK